MACSRREKTGTCGHTQCPYPEHSGYNCVMVLGEFCEVGEDCYSRCEYSWKSSDKATSHAALVTFDAANMLD